MFIPQEVKALIERLEAQGFSAYAVGGAVRDALRGVSAADWDLTTSALPEDVCRVFSDLPTVPTGLAHGTVTVLCGSFAVEITTFRSDGEYRDHRHPEGVSFGCTLEEDLARRDFTVNAIAYSPSRGFIDPFDGKGDIKKKLLRCVGDPRRRFGEDALRILRALRFSSALGYAVEEATSRALRDCLEDLKSVSAERICREWSLLLMGKDVCRVLEEYPELFSFLVPRLAEQREAYRFHCSLIAPASSFWLRLSFLLTDPSVSPEENASFARGVLKRWRFKNEDLQKTQRILSFGRSFPAQEVERMLLLGKYPVEFFDFFAYHCAFSGEDEKALSRWAKEQLDSGRCLCLSCLAVNGRDLLKEGFEGPQIARALEALLRLVASGRVENEKESLLTKARKMKNTDSL